jgi:hypothetical protein
MYKRDRKGKWRIDIYELYLNQLLVILFVNIPCYGKTVMARSKQGKEGKMNTKIETIV